MPLLKSVLFKTMIVKNSLTSKIIFAIFTNKAMVDACCLPLKANSDETTFNFLIKENPFL